ncbi:nSTAND1 domain-containing NTPase [Micromonospora deserti]|uniref:HTH cro/C1-type domain-containing protein n=1 Tax=Micromonospora deserti TaxID=2070366 RepID=A0A2W2DRE9_9ACTN|nr:helix-turn-helix domain-containing protein [Micromonospora deserti]PZF99756.1 hypothetical protein C1I99_10770 [Micromonospora deserti]
MGTEPVLDPIDIVDRDDLRTALSSLRQQAGLTIRQVAAAADIPFSTVGGYFAARHLPAPAQSEQFARILRACGVTDPEPWLDAVFRVRRKLGRPPVSDTAPYRGLESFQPEDAEWFYGREALTQILFDRVADTAVLMIVGPSGAGKSSLLRAGLIAHLDSPSALMTPGPHPLTTLAFHDEAPILIVDQFEEVFTLCEDADERRSFIDALFTRRGVVAGMRADFYPHALRHPRLADALQYSQIIVGPMTDKDLRRTITEPARKARIDLDDGLVELLVRELAPTARDGDGAHDAGALPLLSHALLATWEHGPKGRMSVEDYRASGGIDGAIGQTAESIYAQLTAGQQDAARRLFLRLVHVSEDTADTRRRVNHSELIIGDRDTETVLDHFVSGRLLTADADSVEISHEALLIAWPRLRSWIDVDRVGMRIHRRLTEAARQWEDSGRDQGALYRGGRLSAALDWVDHGTHRQDLNPLEREFLDASLASERRRLRRTYQLVAGLVVLALVAATLAAYAFQQRGAANRERDLAISRQVAITANRLRETDPALAAQLSLAAYRIAPTVEANSSLLASTAVPQVTRMVRPSRALQAVAVSPDGRLLAAAGATKADHEILLWRLDDPARPVLVDTALTGHTGPIYTVAFSPDGRLLATGSTDRTIRLWDVANPNRPTAIGEPLTGFEERVLATAFTPDGAILAAGGADKTVRLWNISDPHRPSPIGQPLSGAKGAVQSIAFAPAGKAFAVADAAGAVHLWDLAGLRATISVPSRVNAVVFTPGGKTLAVGSNDAMVRTWNVEDLGRPVPAGEPVKAATGWINALTFSSDGRVAAVANADSAVQLWDLAGRRLLGTLPHPEPVTAVAFLHDDRTLLTNSADGIGRLWTVPGPVLPRSDKTVTTVAFHPRDRLLAAAGADVQLWDVTDANRPVAVGPPLLAPPGYDRMAGTVAISPDGRTLAAGTRQGNTVVLWDISDRHAPVRRKAALTGPTSLVENIRFSPDGSLIAVASRDGTVHLWQITDVHNPEKLATLKPDSGPVHMIAFSPDGRMLVAATDAGSVPRWDLRDPRSPRPIDPPLRASQDYTYSVTFSPDGRTLAAGNADGTVQLWDVRGSTHATRRLTGPDGYVLTLVFSPDGRRLAAGTGTGQTWLWDFDAHQIRTIAVLETSRDNIWTLAFSPDTHLLAAANGGIRVTDADPAKVADKLCAALGDVISEAEWHKYASGGTYRNVCR